MLHARLLPVFKILGETSRQIGRLLATSVAADDAVADAAAGEPPSVAAPSGTIHP